MSKLLLGIICLLPFFFIFLMQVNSETEEYVMKKEDKTVILFGMSHIASCNFFEYFNRKYVKNQQLFFITEGIRDRTNQLKGKMEIKYIYIPFFNICEQNKEIFFSPETSENGDIDFSELSQETKEFLIKLSTLSRFEVIKQNIFSNSLRNGNIMKDVLHKRNEKIYKKITQSGKKLVVVPWGNEHIKYIVTQLQRDGYNIEKKEIHKPFLFFE